MLNGVAALLPAFVGWPTELADGSKRGADGWRGWDAESWEVDPGFYLGPGGVLVFG